MNPTKRLLLSSILFAGLSLQATVTPVRFYHLGEDDASASNRLVATSSADSVSTNALSFTGAPKYWVEAAPANPGSTYSILFATADQGSATVVTNINNVCLEAWASTGWRNTHVIAYNGNPSLDGYGIILNQTNYLAVLGGVGTVATVPCPPGYWMHLALVCQNGTVAFYTNGILAAITNATPNPPTGNLTVGGPNTVAPFVDSSYDVQGFVDDVRISTFGPGAFTASDLLIFAGQPRLSISFQSGQAIISAPGNITLENLETTTNLLAGNWQNVGAPQQSTWTNSLNDGAAHYYRLNFNPAAGSPAISLIQYLGAVGFYPQTITSDDSDILEYDDYIFDEYGGTPGLATDYIIPDVGVNAGDENLFDASGNVDPLTRSTNTLIYHWQMRLSEAYGGLPFTSDLVTNYDSAVLDFIPESLPDMAPLAGDPESPYWRVQLSLRHIPYTYGVTPSQENFFLFSFQYLSSTDMQPLP